MGKPTPLVVLALLLGRLVHLERGEVRKLVRVVELHHDYRLIGLEPQTGLLLKFLPSEVIEVVDENEQEVVCSPKDTKLDSHPF